MAFSKTHLLRKVHKIPPAIVAFLIQFASLIFIALVLSILWQVNKYKLTLLEVIVVQASLTLLMTRWLNLAWWWSVIQPLFPVAILLMLELSLSPLIYFLLFSFLLVFYWSTFRTQVPYFPSSKLVWSTVEQLLPRERSISFVDIGSGLGGLVLYLGKRFSDSQFLGVEIAPLPWLLSYLRTVGQHNNTQFIRSNYENLHFAQFDVIFAYLSPAAMPNLWIKAKSEMRPGSLLISTEFPIVGVDADLCICLESGQLDKVGNGVNVYLWRL